MGKGYEQGILQGYLLRGDVRAAMAYLREFPEQAERYQKYASLFEQGRYLTYDADGELNELLLIYQTYYRDVFYLGLDPARATEAMGARFAEHFRLDSGPSIDEIEEEHVAPAFRGRGLRFLGGRTSGRYGPYIWRTEELRTYRVELPEGVQDYAVKFLDGFLSRSWLDYISFGETGTGGWSNGDGLIHCVKQVYDTESESFRVSLLKHEAQHALDLARYPGMTSEDLEYRAKLVELIYSEERNMMTRFDGEADAAKKSDGHALASSRIVEGFAACLGPGGALDTLSIKDIQAIAGRLFAESARDVAGKYPARTDVEQGAL